MRSFSILFIILLAMCNLAQGQQIPADPKVIKGKLSNGLTYYIRHNEQPKDRAEFYIVQKVGSIQEEENQRGLAHFLEHMAFNGTKNFPGNTLITEMEKKGVKFGTNINAYTSFDRTVYNLSQIPVTREGLIDTALLILNDWSGFITLNDKDIDEERGVVREEWRTRSSATTRVYEKMMETLYAGTPYANRMPIGLMEVVNNFPYQDLRDYYKKWYRPDLQAIIVVGDIDADAVEKKIKALFADIPAPRHPAALNSTSVPHNTDPIFIFAADPELTSTDVRIYWKLDAIPPETRSDQRYLESSLYDQAIAQLFNARLNEQISKPFAPLKNGGASISELMSISLKRSWSVTGIPRDSNVLEVVKILLTENERMRRYGFTSAELEQVKTHMLKDRETTYGNREKKSNGQYVNDYTWNFLENHPYPTAEWQYETVKAQLRELSLDTLNSRMKQMIKEDNMVFAISGPEKDRKNFPSQQQILDTWSAIKKQELKPYVKLVSDKPLMAKKPKPGKVVKIAAGPFNSVCWTLSNGATVYIKQTDSKEGNVLFDGISPGGLSLIGDKDLPSAKVMHLINNAGVADLDKEELQRRIIGKNIGFSIQMGSFQEVVSGSADVGDLEAMFQLAWLRLTAPQKDTAEFSSFKEGQKRWNKQRMAEAGQIFMDTLEAMKSNHHPRARSFQYEDVLNSINYDRTFQLYKERFGNAGDFTYLITGNVKPDSIKPLVETYLASLPSTGRKEQFIDRGVSPPKGRVKNHFTFKMKTPKVINSLTFTGIMPFNLETQVLSNYLTSILSMRYIQSMREKEGGTYGAYVLGGTEKFPKDKFIFVIRFDTDPAKQKRMLEIAYQEIEKVSAAGPEVEEVKKVKDNLLKSYKEELSNQDNGYWGSAMITWFTYGLDYRSNYEKTVNSITPEMIRDFAKKVFSQGNVMEVVMGPE